MIHMIKRISLLTIVGVLYATVILAGTTSYQYDDLHRLTRVELSNGTITLYEYDALGNRTQKTVTANTTFSAQFTASPTEGLVPLDVAFTDQSTGNITSWLWDFGDGDTSTLQNPVHTYQVYGSYTAQMTVTDINDLTDTNSLEIDVFDTNTQEIVVLTVTSPDTTIEADSSVLVYGTESSNQITLESGAEAELLNFPGQNSIQIQANSNLFTVSRSGATVTFQGSDGTVLKIPAGTSVQTVDFSDGMTITLSIYGGQVMLDDQEITTIPASIEESQEESVSCGAYVAPGVWKEFDCYNLAAIGKTTNDDPFTPSWRLIGGYWQWGRKGPDPSQWYDTNTEHFAHGPTGSNSGDANSGEISNWDDEYASDGAWSDASKTANDPCPAGYRVPTKSQWEGVLDNNSQSTEGTWGWYDTNYSSARFFGEKLMLLSAGYRYDYSGSLYRRGSNGYYWSSTEDSGNSCYAWSLNFISSYAYTYDYCRRDGFSVRCIAE